MFLLSYQLDDAHLVVELDEVVDLDNEAAVERELVRLLPCCGPRAVIVDIITPLLTARALGLLLRVRGHAGDRGVPMAAVARHAVARTVLSGAGLDRVLRVARSLPGAELRARGCRPRARTGEASGRQEGPGVPPLPVRPSGRVSGPHAPTSLPRYPRGR
ncbi:anti-sigma factor antagonist [Streptomyces sp. NPDC049916]|uniref:anti-sigma factor antagonist n=1 Tax=Streptomyces sp. NPDC049916 TaxID=3155156 RepID=UPI00341C1289